MDNENIIKEEVSQNEQITMIKKNLTEWCKKQSNGNITDFGDRIEIVEICKSGIIKFDIKTRYVRRELEERKTMPYNGQEIPEEPSLPLDLWAYNTQGQNDNELDDRIISYTEFLKEKAILRDKAETAEKLHNFADSCFLNHELENYTSYERYNESLFEKNRAYYPLKETFSLSICPECAGDGKVFCWRCGGSGKILEYDKRVYCPNCAGAKKVICSSCDGKKKVVTHTALFEHFTYEEESKFCLLNDNLLPETFKVGIETLNGYENNTSFELNQDNYKEILKTIKENEPDNPSKKQAKVFLMDTIQTFMEEKCHNLSYNQKINNFTIHQSSLEYLIVKYKYDSQEFFVVLYGKDNNAFAPVNAYPSGLKDRKNRTKETISKNETCQTEIPKSDISEKSRKITLLLCIFFGWFGGHRYYTKKIISGILQFVLVIFYGLGLFWVAIDLILILSGKFKDKDKKYILK